MIRSDKGKRLWQLVGFNKSFSFVIFSSLPGIIATFFLLYFSDFDSLETVTMLTVVLIPWLLALIGFYISAIGPWKTVANILMSFREGDYSIRASTKHPNDAVGLVLNELNTIADYLYKSRRSELTSRKLMDRLLIELDVAVFLFDNQFKLVMVNTYGAKLYEQPAEHLIGKTIKELELEFAQLAVHSSSHEHKFPNRKSRWLVKNSGYRQHGLPHKIMLLADIGQNLRAEELVAWQKLIRILSHEINNAMTPLKTTVGAMKRLLKKDELPSNWRDSFIEGADIIDQRVDNLARLVSSYAQVSQLPKPEIKTFQLTPLLLRVQESFQPQNIQLAITCEYSLAADEAQLEQVLINLLKNAFEANAENSNSVVLAFEVLTDNLMITISDNGQGIENLDNLFIPYFTTKANGNGIGLFLSRQIVEAHGGTIELTNRIERQGCLVTISLPLQ